MYDGVTVVRTLTYHKLDEIGDHDTTTSANEHEYAGEFNTGERVEVSEDGYGFVLSDPANGKAVELVQEEDVDDVRHYLGQTDPLMDRASRAFGEAHPVCAMLFAKRRRSVELATRLVIRH